VYRENIIGRFFADEWQRALNNLDEFYTPEPAIDMSLDTLYGIRGKLTQLVNDWSVQLDPAINSAWEAIANAQAIVDLEQKKLDTVNVIIAAKEAEQNQPTGDTGASAEEGPVTDELQQPVDNSKMWLIAGGIGVAAVLLLRKKKNKKIHGMNNNTLMWLGIGTLALIAFSKKQTAAAALPEGTTADATATSDNFAASDPMGELNPMDEIATTSSGRIVLVTDTPLANASAYDI